jgi:hypothetical protein
MLHEVMVDQVGLSCIEHAPCSHRDVLRCANLNRIGLIV